MVNLRQSISTFRVKGKDVISASPSPKLRKSVMVGASPITSSKRMSTLGKFKIGSKDKNDKDENDPNDLSSHIGEIKVNFPENKRESNQRFGSLQGFTVEEETNVVEDDLARKTDLKLQERREQRRKRQEELQKQLQQKLHQTADNTDPNLQDDSFPGALPLEMDSEESSPTPRVSGGRKSTLIRNKRAGALDRPIRASVGTNQAEDPTSTLRSPGRRMPRKSRFLDSADHQVTGARPFSMQKETSAEHRTIQESDEDERMPGRPSREPFRKARWREEGANGDTSNGVDAGIASHGDRFSLTDKAAGQQTSSRRERRKTEMNFGSTRNLRSQDGENSSSSPGNLSSSYRSSTGRSNAEIRERLRQSVRPVRDMPELLGALDASLRSERGSGVEDNRGSTGRKSKFSWDEDNDQRGLSSHSDHRVSSSRHKRRDKMEFQDQSPLHHSEHGGKGRVARRSERLQSPNATKRKTLIGLRDEVNSSPQSETRKLRKSRKQRRESETMRTNRTVDDGLAFDDWPAETKEKERSSAVRFRDDVKAEMPMFSPKPEGKPKPRAGESPRVSSSKRMSPRVTASKKSPRVSPSKYQKEDVSNAAAVDSPPVFDDEYGDEGVPSKKKEAPSWALENADSFKPQDTAKASPPKKKEAPSWAIENAEVYDPQVSKSDSKPSTKPPLQTLESMDEASESQRDFDFQEESRNRRPDFDSGENWLEPVNDDEVPTKPAVDKGTGEPDAKDASARPEENADQIEQVPKSHDGAENELTEDVVVEKPSAAEDPDAIVNENASASSGEYSSESEETPEIPKEVPVVDEYYSKRVSALPMAGVSSSESGSSSSGESSSSSESERRAKIPTVVSIEDLEQLVEDDVSSASMHSASFHEDDDDDDDDEEESVENSEPKQRAYEEQILPSSFRKERSTVPLDDDIPPPPPYPPPDSPPTRNKKTRSSDASLDNMFANEILALEGTLLDMGGLFHSPPPPTNTKMNGKGNASRTQEALSSSADWKLLMDILSLIAPFSSEQKTLMESNPSARKEVMVAAAEQERRRRQQMIQKVETLESKLSTLRKDLEIQQLENATHKMQVATQDVIILEYKDSLEFMTQNVQSLEKETEAMTLKSREQDEKAYQMMESLEETKKLVREQQMLISAQQKQMQTMEEKISSLQQSRTREESSMSMQNEKLREIIRIQKEAIMKALGVQEEAETYDL